MSVHARSYLRHHCRFNAYMLLKWNSLPFYNKYTYSPSTFSPVNATLHFYQGHFNLLPVGTPKYNFHPMLRIFFDISISYFLWICINILFVIVAFDGGGGGAAAQQFCTMMIRASSLTLFCPSYHTHSLIALLQWHLVLQHVGRCFVVRDGCCFISTGCYCCCCCSLNRLKCENFLNRSFFSALFSNIYVYLYLYVNKRDFSS